jgi:molecular chaperone GrpE (heat shock protein)
LSPVVAVLEDMVSHADFSDGATLRGHIESLAMTVNSALTRMGIERMPVVAGSDLFDSRMHSCVRVCAPEDSPFPSAPTRTIVRVQSPGFLIRGNVVQPAQVWVQKIDTETNQPEREGL